MALELFASMLGIAGISAGIYSYYFDRKSLFPILVAVLFSFFVLEHWVLAPSFLLLFLFRKKMGFGMFSVFNVFSAVLMSYFMLRFFSALSAHFLAIAFFSAFLICVLAVAGMKQTGIREFLLISSAVYILFALLNLSVGKMAGNPTTLNHLHIFNYSIAGLCLFLSLGVFIGKKKLVHELEGSFIEDKWNSSFAVVSCLSLAGLPAFNMFVSHYNLIKSSFLFSPPLALLTVFSSLLLIVMYCKLVCALLVGAGRKAKKPIAVTSINAVFALVIILMGLLPFIQTHLIKLVS